MDKNSPQIVPQIASGNNPITLPDRSVDSLADWIELYFQVEDTTLESSRKVKKRDLEIFLKFYQEENGDDLLKHWTPRLSKKFLSWLTSQVTRNGKRRWNDRTANRILIHVKAVSKWIHKHRPFTLGNPCEKVKSIATQSLLDVERALTTQERRRILDAADELVISGGKSKDRNRHGHKEIRPKRKTYRPYRNRAIIYTLIGTGMRRAAICPITLDDVDRERRRIRTIEKGNKECWYSISREAMEAILKYIEVERDTDNIHYHTNRLFLPAHQQTKNGQISSKTVSTIWAEVCEFADVEGKSPHSARHAMGVHVQKKTQNPSAVQRQLNHSNALYCNQYMRITEKELKSVLDDME